MTTGRKALFRQCSCQWLPFSDQVGSFSELLQEPHPVKSLNGCEPRNAGYTCLNHSVHRGGGGATGQKGVSRFVLSNSWETLPLWSHRMGIRSLRVVTDRQGWLLPGRSALRLTTVNGLFLFRWSGSRHYTCKPRLSTISDLPYRSFRQTPLRKSCRSILACLRLSSELQSTIERRHGYTDSSATYCLLSQHSMVTTRASLVARETSDGTTTLMFINSDRDILLADPWDGEGCWGPKSIFITHFQNPGSANYIWFVINSHFWIHWRKYPASRINLVPDENSTTMRLALNTFIFHVVRFTRCLTDNSPSSLPWLHRCVCGGGDVTTYLDDVTTHTLSSSSVKTSSKNSS